jgi:hypothetical protein
VGREKEAEALRQAFAGLVKEKRTSMVLVRGESGVGKSALIRNFLEGVREQALLLSGRCYERESVHFKAFDSVIDSMAAHLQDGDMLLESGEMSLLVQTFPVLEKFAGASELKTLDAEEKRSIVFGALRRLLSRLGERQPLVVVIDDIQWADTDSLSLLRELLRPPDAPQLLLVASYRTAKGAEPLAPSLKLPISIQEIEVVGLPEEEAIELAERLCESLGAHSQEISVRALAKEQTDIQISRTLNARQIVSATGAAFTRDHVQSLRRTHAIPSLVDHLRRAGWLTVKEIAAQLGIHPHTAKAFAHEGVLRAVRGDDAGRLLFELPAGPLPKAKRLRDRSRYLPCVARTEREVQYAT